MGRSQKIFSIAVGTKLSTQVTNVHRALTLSRPNLGIDLLSCKAADLTEEDLLAKNKNYIPRGNYNISEWIKVVNSGFRLGQHFFLNDM